MAQTLVHGAPCGRLIEDQLAKKICVRAELRGSMERGRRNFEPFVTRITPFALMARTNCRGVDQTKPWQRATALFDANALHHFVDVGWAIASVG